MKSGNYSEGRSKEVNKSLRFVLQLLHNKYEMPFISTITRLLLWLALTLYSKALSLVYRQPSKTVPPLKNWIYLESASSLAEKIRNKKITSSEIVESFIEQVKEVNEDFNCVVHERYEAAMQEARQADELVKSGKKSAEELESETPLLGVPFTAKDSVLIKGLLNSAGIWNRKDLIADEDAEVVALMRKAGAIPLACTNSSEACFAPETNNPLFGRTCNPYNSNRSAGGSSGGEACLVASCGSPIGIGSDSKGFDLIPCAFAGVFGHRPSANTCPLRGAFPETSSYNAITPMSKSARDLLLMLKILTKNSQTDLRLDEPVDVKQLKYYIVDTDDGCPFSSPVDTEIKEAMQKAADYFRTSHKAAVQRVELENMKKAFHIWWANKEKDFGKKFAVKNGKINAAKELVQVLCGNSHHTFTFLMNFFIDEKLEIQNGPDKEKFTKARSELFAELQNLLGTDGVLIYPTQPTAALFHNESPAKIFNAGYAGIFNALGLPATHCPMGLNSQDLPIGFQVVAGLNQDRLTLAVANEIDKALGGWKPPPTHASFTLKRAALKKSKENEKVF